MPNPRTQVNFRCDQDVLDEVHAAKEATGDSQPDILRQALNLWRECRNLESGESLAVVDRNRRNKVKRFVRVG